MSDTTSRTDVQAERAGEEQPPVPDESGKGVAPQPAEPGSATESAQGRDRASGLTAPRVRPAENIPSAWGNVPPRNPNFTGRQEFLDQLRQRLAAGGTTAVLPAALHGMGGIGKTQIAVEYIYRHLRDYDLIWWIQAAQPAQIRASLTELAQRLRLPGSAEANTAVPVVREALRIGQPFSRWLLVFDSAEAPQTVREFFPPNGPGEILITSRNPGWVGIARPLELEVFKRSESVELLRRRGPEIGDEEADQLGDKLGDLPLAIEQAAAWRAETGMPVREYLRLFDEKVAEILDTSAPADYEVSVAAAWNVSFDELQRRNPAAHQLLQICAFFSPEPISRSIFTGVRGISIAAELDSALRDPMQLGRAIRDINRYGLAKIDHRNDTIQLHRLVQLVLVNRMTPQHRAEMRHGAHLLLANLDPNDPIPSVQWPRYQDILPHAFASKVVECEDRWVGQLVLNLMTFLYYWGDHEEAAQLAQQAVDRWSASRGEDDLQTLRAATNLGYYLWVLGKYPEAAEINQRTLARYRQVSGENSEETLTALSAVTTDLKAAGEFTRARDLSQEVYEKAKGLFGDDDPTTLLTAHNFGVGLRLTGEYERARRLDEDTYQRRAEVLGYDHADTIGTLNGLILDRREAGEYSWARAGQETAVERARALFGEDKAAFLSALFNLSVARRKDGDHPGALGLSGEVLARFRLRYGDDSPSTMASALAHSIDLRHAGDLDQSRKLGEQTFERYRVSLGEHHPHTLSAAVDLAVALRQLGESKPALQLDERSLAKFRASLGPDHPYAIVSAINLASDLAAAGDDEAALAMGTEALERAQAVLGAEHPTALAASANLVLDLRAAGRAQEADARFAEVLAQYRRVLSETHPGTIRVSGGVRADCDIDPLPL
jgi:tetratricopeptide (TPR) repeat protein